MKVRDEEMDELDDMIHDYCEVKVCEDDSLSLLLFDLSLSLPLVHFLLSQAAGGAENVHGKVNILLQSHLSRGRVNAFSLVSDLNYVVQNGTRIARALFEVSVDRHQKRHGKLVILVLFLGCSEDKLASLGGAAPQVLQDAGASDVGLRESAQAASTPEVSH